jgi:hypothetical protein
LKTGAAVFSADGHYVLTASPRYFRHGVRAGALSWDLRRARMWGHLTTFGDVLATPMDRSPDGLSVVAASQNRKEPTVNLYLTYGHLFYAMTAVHGECVGAGFLDDQTLAVATADAAGAASVELLKLEMTPEFREQAIRGRRKHLGDGAR